jgi:hypothetical protein
MAESSRLASTSVRNGNACTCCAYGTSPKSLIDADDMLLGGADGISTTCLVRDLVSTAAFHGGIRSQDHRDP